MRLPASFGEWTQRRRKGMGITQAELADQVGCATVTIRKIEQDERRPSYDLAVHLARALQIPADQHPLFIEVAIGTAPLQALTTKAPSNLPALLAPIIGRAQEHAAAMAALRGGKTRLLTLAGPGGIGKTHLSLHLAEAMIDHFADGIWVVDLSVVTDPSAVAVTIAQTIGCPIPAPHLALSVLCAYLRERFVCLVIDNFEHLMVARTVVVSLLRECLWTSMIITSREPLNLQAELVLRLKPLTYPAQGGDAASEEVLSRHTAVQLFVARAKAVNPEFLLTAHNTAAVIELCQRLDGIPLAIEVIAGQSALLSPTAILQRFHQHLPQLASPLADRPPRHHTVHDAIAWSYALLSATEQRLFARLAVFVGGWTTAAMEFVCADGLAEQSASDTPRPGARLDPSTLLPAMFALLHKSMIISVDVEDKEPRFSLLSTMRTFAHEQLWNLQEADLIAHRHAAYYAELCTGLSLETGAERLNRLAFEEQNIRSAVRWAADHHAGTLIYPLTTGLDVIHQQTQVKLHQIRQTAEQLEHLVAERTHALEETIETLAAREGHLQKLTETLLHTNRRLDAAEDLKTRFIQTISHDVYTMLNTIIGFSELLPHYGGLSDRQRHLIGRIHTTSDQFAQFFSSIIELVNGEQQRLEYAPVPTSLAEHLRAAIDQARSSLGHLTLNWQVPGHVPPINADPHHLTPLLQRVLEAMGDWTATGSITIRVQADTPEWIVLLFQDTSGGLPPRDLERLFQPFTSPMDLEAPLRATTLVSLALSYQVIDHTGGAIWIENTPPDGATCFLKFPAAAP
ncbi:MAG TPA: ATP-binding protein [Herpetosiphonaceae bacterium]|nr:ATP-binding protein [Herpetosiphonaceae bacterium]